MSEDSKAQRKARKSALTREINATERYMAEDNIPETRQRLENVKQKFIEFEKAHEKYHDELTEEADIDVSDDYFYDVQKTYISALKHVKQWLQDNELDKKVKDEKHPATSDEMGRTEILGLMNLPKLELESFDGDPIKFHSFFAAFDEHVDGVTANPRIKLTRLLQCTSGKAKDAIRFCSLIGGEKGYFEAREILKRRFGNDHLISERVIQNLRSGKPIRSPDDLQQLADDLTNSHATLSSLNRLNEVDTQSSIADIGKRLQPYLWNRWKRLALDKKREQQRYPDFTDFVKFVLKEAEEMSDPVYGSVNTGGSRSTHHSKPKVSSTSFVSGATPTQRTPPPCIMCQQPHRLFACEKFKAMKPRERLELVVCNKLCHNCLMSNHVTVNCRKPSVCSVPGCGEKHTKFIHIDPKFDHKPNSDDTCQTVAKVNHADTVIATSQSNVSVCVPIVEVVVNDVCNTSVLLDNASTSSFCTKRLADSLGIVGKTVNYTLSTLSDSQQTKQTKEVDLSLMSLDGASHLKLSNVYIIDNIPVNMPKFAVSDYVHLQDIPVPSVSTDVDILIGQDHAEALLPLQIRRGKPGEPFAIKTLLGWSINGCIPFHGSVSKKVISHFISTSCLDDKIRKLWEIEREQVYSGQASYSQEDKSVIELWDKSVNIVDGHYELPIPWKPEVHIPNNISVAMSRLRSLRVSLEKRGLNARYQCEIDKLLSMKYAEYVPYDQIHNSGKVWYLPHQAVLNSKKPDKLRIVFDCASKYMGESLNDKCYQGPDLNNKLVNVLLRFRQHSVAVMADIEAMYYQVKIPEHDRDALRFLWYDNCGNVVHYRMTSHVFGGVWCAASSTYALRKTLEDNNVDEMVSSIVRRAFYVDDCLISVQNTEHAVKAMLDTRYVLSKAGFKLTKFVSNDLEVLSKFPIAERAKEVVELNFDSNSKALGIKWNVFRDELYFETDIDADKVTKRVMLSIVSSTYDPLGLVSPIVVVGRILFQEAVRLKLSWDEMVPSDLLTKWKTWISALHHLSDVRISRCIKPSVFDDSALELHHFSDASTLAYGSCSYLRCVNKIGEIHVNLLMSKSRVAPLKPITIPRLELLAAVLSVKSDDLLRQELDLKIIHSYFWTDSEIVLKYIKNESRRFQVFVANRVSVIHNFSSPSQWYHISGQANPADLLTRGQDPRSMDLVKWYHGPTFLASYKNQWRIQPIDVDIPRDDPEVKRTGTANVVSHAVSTKEHPIDALIGHYSSWYRLKRAVGWLLILQEQLRSKDQNREFKMTVDVLKRAEVLIIQVVQQRCYAKEIAKLAAGKPVDKGSPIRSLSPVLDDIGVMCAGGRLSFSSVGNSKKHPILVPHSNPVAKLIVKDLHDVAHLGVEWTLSLLRGKYWITKARSVIRSVRSSCIICKKLYASPCNQQMANLPPERLEPGKPCFSYVGLDCFGPFYVKVGRSEVKRYGCIFTCLTTRAVHIEKLDQLDTDAFLNGFRRFVARRGSPLKVWSDNGTNFVGAQAEVAKGIKEISSDRIKSFSVQRNIDWVFNPPHASHMGGIWERLIRTIRKVLSALLFQAKRLTDDVLVTLFHEVESIVNGRPLTKVSNNVDDPVPLTPNHLLLLQNGPVPPAGVFQECDMYKKRWRYVQYLSDQFWRRWLREYIPELQKRNKWLNQQYNVKVGDLALIIDENTPRCLWPLGLVTDVKLGRDNLVRSVTVKTKSTSFVRPVSKIVMLEKS